MNARRVAIELLVISLVVGGALSLLASAHPDGLEFVAEHLGFIDRAAEGAWAAPVPDYAVPSVPSEALAGSLAGILGVVVTFAVGWGIAAVLSRPGKAG
ncbi:MAG: PDGLE domain-containing protein [Firmicutes bacterium]|nr:PDGLE domain-containing protein [Bacillota bacterium]